MFLVGIHAAEVLTETCDVIEIIVYIIIIPQSETEKKTLSCGQIRHMEKSNTSGYIYIYTVYYLNRMMCY